MPPIYPILPSLSRAPDFASTRKAEDGTIADPAESGYVSTRPRFTRIRRTFGVTYKNLVAEDLRVLDKFEIATVKGKAGAFYMPNLLPNGSFEFPATLPSELVSGWVNSSSSVNRWTVSLSTFSASGVYGADDGQANIYFHASGPSLGTPEDYSLNVAELASTTPFAVAVGDVLAYSIVAAAGVDMRASAFVRLYLHIAVTYADDSSAAVYSGLIDASSTTGWNLCTGTMTIPANGASPAVSATVAFRAELGAGDGTAYSVSFSVDSAGLALAVASQPFGRMPGSSPVASAVRFTKLPEIKDALPAGGVKRYDATFEVTEV